MLRPIRLCLMYTSIATLLVATVAANAPDIKLVAKCSPVGALNIRFLGKTFPDRTDPTWFYVVGSWGASDRKTPSISPINAAEIECDKRRRICRETLAVLENAVRGEALLMVLGEDYRVVEWSETTVRAMRKARAADVELFISLEHETAERVLRETATRGAQNASPSPERWTLQ